MFFGLSDVNGDGTISTDVSSSYLLFLLHRLKNGAQFMFVIYPPIYMQESNDLIDAMDESSSDEDSDDEDLAEVRNG